MKAIKRTVNSSATDARNSSDPAYARRISLYHFPPAEDISLEEFERFGKDRLTLLQEVAAAKATGKSVDMVQSHIKTAMEKYVPLRHNNFEDIRKDVISHFVLRLAFCQNQHRSWFIAQEVALLEHRLRETGTRMPEFLSENGLNYKSLSEEDFKRHEGALRVVYSDASSHTASDYFPVPFNEASALLKGRRVYLFQGTAIVHAHKLIHIVSLKFKEELSRALALTAKAHAQFADERLLGLLSTWANGYLLGSTPAFVAGSHVDMSKIDSIAEQHFPLCMKHTHRALRTRHHLRHMGRMQYGLFLKGIGVSLDESINFWKAELLKGPDIDEKKFNSSYAYNIRHNYGKEGKRMNYNPYGCIKVINSVPASGDVHGCPFRNSKAEELMQDMQSSGIGPVGAAEVIELLKGHHYQIACKRYFDLTHPNNKNEEAGTTHPNTYYNESVKYWDERSAAAASASTSDAVKK